MGVVGAAAMRRLVPIAALALASCSGMQSPLDPAADQAGALFSLFGLMLLVCGVMYLLVMAALGWGLLRARRRNAGSNDAGLARALYVWGGLIVMGLTVLIVGSFIADRSLASTRGREALLVRVTGHQWWWRIQYRDAATGRWIETANELHLPLGRTTRVLIGTADVIHSFWIPNLAGKQDLIPGRANAVDLTPRRLGRFRGQCAEFCGAQHAHMAFDVQVEPPARFDHWLVGQASSALPPADAEAERGEQVLAGGQCGACHVVRGTAANGRNGPDLTHLASRRSIAAGTLAMTRGNLQGWIAQPQAIKPGAQMPAVTLSGPDADALSHYLVGLK